MIQDIAPKRFYNEHEVHTISKEDAVLCYKEGKACMSLEYGMIQLPQYDRFSAITSKEEYTYLFRIDEVRYFLYEGKKPLQEPEGYRYIAWSNYRDYGPMHELLAVSVGSQLSNWYTSHKFCGICGSVLTKSIKERALYCDSCKHTIYPTISPSVIVGIVNGDRLLLTKYAYGSYKKYALVAGYSEVGESIEETVHREVKEEVGLTVKNLSYYKSQPWPASSSMLFGFFVEVDGDDTVLLQEEELTEGTWFTRETLPKTSSTISLTNEMIEYFRSHPEDFPAKEQMTKGRISE